MYVDMSTVTMGTGRWASRQDPCTWCRSVLQTHYPTDSRSCTRRGSSVVIVTSQERSPQPNTSPTPIIPPTQAKDPAKPAQPQAADEISQPYSNASAKPTKHTKDKTTHSQPPTLPPLHPPVAPAAAAPAAASSPSSPLFP